MAAEKNKIDAIKLLESEGVLNSDEARRCIEVLNNDTSEFEDDLFFAD